MAARSEGVVLLVAGHGADGTRAFDASMVHTLGQIGEALLATGARWNVRRLRAGSADRHGADRATLKRELDELVADDARVAVLVVLGSIVELPAGPALVTGVEHRAYPEDAVLPLAWIGDRLRAAKAEHVLAIVSAKLAGPALDPDMPTERYAEGAPARPSQENLAADVTGWLAALATTRPADVIAVDAVGLGSPLADALLEGLCGDALDPRTGTVTFRSMSDHLARTNPRAALQASTESQTVSTSPPLAGLWDVRRSQLSVPSRARALEPEELLGTVLPGRFRIDTLVARGTFGTVYRARQLAVDRDVAVKVLHAEIDPSSEDGRLFVHEIRSVGRIDHANVVRIHQADMTHDGRLFFAMELLDGRDLQSLAADGTMPRARAVAIVRDLLAGLGAAHDAGLVHADVKPANAIVIARDALPQRVVLVDFGLARLRPPDRPAESAGGTPAFMAPEQLHEGRVDARSDLFSAALVLVFLLTGWRRTDARTLVPPDGTIGDPALAAVLARALALEPAKRYATAGELSDALAAAGGESRPPKRAATATSLAVAAPFRHLEPLTEHDLDRFHGRDRDLATLVDHVLYGRSVIYTAPSGTGKTSLLRAGLVPRLEALGITAIYVRCRDESLARIVGAIWPGATSLGEAVAQHRAQRKGALVLILDQLEAALASHGALVEEIAARHDLASVLSVREDHLARLVAHTHAIDATIPIVRLPPLSPQGARDAIVFPLTRARLAMEPELATALLGDLERAAVALGRDLGWGGEPAVYPPHLQLACSVLYDALAPGEATLTLAHYRALGGFDAIVGEYLERVLDTELDAARVKIARELFIALVTTNNERAAPTEAALIEAVGARYPLDEVTAVLEVLRARGLLVRVRTGGELRWELVHDSLVPRVLAWLDRAGLARRRAVELVRYHVRRSRPEVPSLLGRVELRELRGHDDAVAELDAEYKKRGDTDGGWMPAKLVARSKAAFRNRVLTIGSVIAVLAILAAGGMWRSRVAAAAAAREQVLKLNDLGRFRLAFEPYDWDAAALAPRPVQLDALPQLHWELHYPDPKDPEVVGPPFRDEHLVRGDVDEARGGTAFLVVDGRGQGGATCPPSIIGVKLPGYAQRDTIVALNVRVPTCQATRVDMIAIPAGEFIYGGLGDPPSEALKANPSWVELEQTRTLATYHIDRTEVPNAAFAMFAAMSDLTGIRMPAYPHGVAILTKSPLSTSPVTGVTWHEARAYCRLLGKDLPTYEQWLKALRGGVTIESAANPNPRRSFPWGAPIADPFPARLHVDASTTIAPVGTFPLDRSPYGVMDLAGNAIEWTATVNDEDPQTRITCGGDFNDTTLAILADYTTSPNQRSAESRLFSIGMRCAMP